MLAAPDYHKGLTVSGLGLQGFTVSGFRGL